VTHCARMGRTKREIVEHAYAAFARGDHDGFLEDLHPDAEWHWPPGGADAGVYRGAAEIRRGMALWDEPWADFRMEPEELLEREDAVLAIVRYRARGRASGAPVEYPVAHLWEFREGVVVRMRMFGDAEKAKRRFLE
jgi:ketosteroid isomerase-like protein